MNYAEALDWLFTQLPNYQNQGSSAYKPGLERMLTFSEALGNPHQQFKSIHIAGTNGKGSTAHMLASVLQEEGLKIGLFTSPHLKNFTERIKINGKEASPNFVLNFITKIKNFNAINTASFFELTTLMAFEYFALHKVDIAIIETGLGGRLDATNIISPLISVITSIDLDHTIILGDTIEKIAFEKAGIIKKNSVVICSENKPNTVKVIRQQAIKQNARFYNSTAVTKKYSCDLLGDFQQQNQKTMLKAIEILNNTFSYSVREQSVINGLNNIIKNTNLQGRWQVTQHNPTIILDIAHNLAGFTMALNQLQNINPKHLKFVLGFVKDKSIKPIINLLPIEAEYYFVTPKIFRGLAVKEYEKHIKHLNYQTFKNVASGYNEALKKSNKNNTIFVGGSNFVIAEII